jgi:hypothetical protein
LQITLQLWREVGAREVEPRGTSCCFILLFPLSVNVFASSKPHKYVGLLAQSNYD